MKINKLYTSVAAGLLLAAASASAQIPGVFNDVIVGFTNQATNIEINLGTSLQADGPGTYNLGNFNSILSDATTGFGSSWASNSSLTFGAIGSVGSTTTGSLGLNGDPKGTAYVTSAWTSTTGTLGVQNSVSPYSGGATLTSSKLNTIAANVSTVMSAMTDAQATVVIAGKAVSMPTTTSGSWDSKANLGAAFGSFDKSLFSNSVTNVGTGSFVAEDLYKFSPSAAPVFIGTLSLDTSGNLTFTVVPEPSTYAAILGVMTMGIVMIRRRRSSAQLAEIA
jgi:hypothetical protein